MHKKNYLWSTVYEILKYGLQVNRCWALLWSILTPEFNQMHNIKQVAMHLRKSFVMSFTSPLKSMLAQKCMIFWRSFPLLFFNQNDDITFFYWAIRHSLILVWNCWWNIEETKHIFLTFLIKQSEIWAKLLQTCRQPWANPELTIFDLLLLEYCHLTHFSTSNLPVCKNES